jgi:hypothetical protein
MVFYISDFQFVKETKGYVSEVINWLCNLLSYYHPDSRKACQLVSNVKSLYQTLDGYNGPELLARALKITENFVGLYKDLPTAAYIFKPIRTLLDLFKSKEVWTEIQWTDDVNSLQLTTQVQDLLHSLDNLKVKMEPIHLAPEIPKRLRLYEPAVDDKYGFRFRYLLLLRNAS